MKVKDILAIDVFILMQNTTGVTQSYVYLDVT